MSAHAQDPTEAQKSAIRSNCRSDFMSKCSSVTPGGTEAFQCLKKNEASLSGGCRAAVAAIKLPGETRRRARCGARGSRSRTEPATGAGCGGSETCRNKSGSAGACQACGAETDASQACDGAQARGCDSACSARPGSGADAARSDIIPAKTRDIV